MTTLIEKANRNAIFQLELNDRIVYMSTECTNYLNESRYIIVLEAKKFIKLWQNEPNPISKSLNFGTIESWKNDKKYPDAEDGFSFGKNNPVPLANVVCYLNEDNQLPYIAIENGITRTIWLLSNDVKYFPVECRNRNEAQLLVKSAGYKQTDICTVKELLKCD